MRIFINKILLLIVISFASSFSSYAAGDDEMARNYINNFGNRIISIASDNKFTLDQKKEKLIVLIESNVDIDWVSKYVLAKHYRAANDEQRERFKKLYREFMINTYAPKFRGYNGEKFEVTEVSKQGGYYLVKCIFYPKESPQVNLDFRIKKRADNSDFSILDIVAEGVSLIETQRSEFGSAISASGMDNFLSDLEIRVKNLKANPDPEIKKNKAVKSGNNTKSIKK